MRRSRNDTTPLGTLDDFFGPCFSNPSGRIALYHNDDTGHVLPVLLHALYHMTL